MVISHFGTYRVNFSTTPKTLPVLVNLQISTIPTPSPLQSCLTTRWARAKVDFFDFMGHAPAFGAEIVSSHLAGALQHVPRPQYISPRSVLHSLIVRQRFSPASSPPISLRTSPSTLHSDRALSGVSVSPFRTVVSRDTRFVSAPAHTPVPHDDKSPRDRPCPLLSQRIDPLGS
jgi:hypothetical protein